MNFIEKMMNVKTTAADETATEQPQAEKVMETEQTPEQSSEQKNYTEKEITALLDGKKQEWQEEQTAKNQEYLNSLPEAERLKVQQLSKDEEIAKLKSELSRRDLEKTIIAKLDENKLPVSIAQLVQYSDEKSTMKSLDKITGIFNAAVADGVNLRLRGKTPAGLGGAAQAENSGSDPFAKAFTASLKR